MPRNSLAVLLDDKVVYNDYFRLMWLHVLHHHGDFIWYYGRHEDFNKPELSMIKERLKEITKEVAQIDLTEEEYLSQLTKNYNLYTKSLVERIGLTINDLSKDELNDFILKSITIFNGYLKLCSEGVKLSQQIMLSANQFLKNDFKILMGVDYNQFVLHNFSHRHSPRLDIEASFETGTTFFIPDLHLLTEDMAQDLKPLGKSVSLDKYQMRKILDGIEDTSKFAFLYAYAHKMAKQNKDADLTLFVFEGDEQVRSQLLSLFTQYENALPNCQVLFFDQVPCNYYRVIDGKGPIDENFENNLKTLLAPFANQKQKNVNLAAELSKDKKIDQFLETRELLPPPSKLCGSRLFTHQNIPADDNTKNQDERPAFYHGK